MTTKITLYKDNAGEWRWRMKRSGRIVADGGEGYRQRASALHSLVEFLDSPYSIQVDGKVLKSGGKRQSAKRDVRGEGC